MIYRAFRRCLLYLNPRFMRKRVRPRQDKGDYMTKEKVVSQDEGSLFNYYVEDCGK